MNFVGEVPAPCLHCDRRTMICHDDCPDYLSYASSRERIREQRLLESEADSLDRALSMERGKLFQRRRRHKR